MLKWFVLLIFMTAIRTHAVTDAVTEVSLFQKGYENFKSKSYLDAVTHFTAALEKPQVLRDYILFYRGQSYVALNKWAEAQKDLQEISAQESHFKLLLDSRILLAQVISRDCDISVCVKRMVILANGFLVLGPSNAIFLILGKNS